MESPIWTTASIVQGGEKNECESVEEKEKECCVITNCRLGAGPNTQS